MAVTSRDPARQSQANRLSRLSLAMLATAFAAGIAPRRAAELRVRGRRSGKVISFPVAIADFEGERYLVSMLGENVNWVRNLRAADGRAELVHGRHEAVHLEEVDARDRHRLAIALGKAARLDDRRADAHPAAVLLPDPSRFQCSGGAGIVNEGSMRGQ